MRVLIDRIGRAVIGVLAVAGFVVAVRTQIVSIALSFALIFVCLIVSTVLRERSRFVTRARYWLQHRDPSAIVFVCARPDHTLRLERYSTSGSPLQLPGLFPIVADAAGISYFSTDKPPAPLAVIPWSSIDSVDVSDVWTNTKEPRLSVSLNDGHGIVFYIRSLVKGRWDVTSDAQVQLARDIEAIRAFHRP
jgi:hypothetical protein